MTVGGALGLVLVAAIVASDYAFTEWFDLDTTRRQQSASVASIALGQNMLCSQGQCTMQKVSLATRCQIPNTGGLLDQQTFGLGTAFVVGPKRLVTSGHIISELNLCGTHRLAPQLRFVFDVRMNDAGTANATAEANVYTAREVVSCSADSARDIAVIELTRELQGRPAFPLSSAGVTAGDPLSSIGHPLGLPSKSVSGPALTDSGAGMITARLNASRGSSGSPVFNAQGLVVGVLRSIDVPGAVAMQPCAALAYCAQNACVTSAVPAREIVP